MNLWEIQSTAVALMGASANMAGVTVITDDGTFPKTPAREAALATGMAVTVFKPGEPSATFHSFNGVTKMTAIQRVIVEENTTVNRRLDGYKTAEKVAQYVMQAMIGKPSGGAPVGSFRAHQTPFDMLGSQNGVLRVLLNFEIAIVITPE